MKIKFIYLFLFFCLFIKAQIIELDSIKTDYFKKYNIVFLGEQHKILSTDNVETKLVSFIKTNNTKVLLEMDYNKNFILNKFFVENDTINFNFFYNLTTNIILIYLGFCIIQKLRLKP